MVRENVRLQIHLLPWLDMTQTRSTKAQGGPWINYEGDSPDESPTAQVMLAFSPWRDRLRVQFYSCFLSVGLLLSAPTLSLLVEVICILLSASHNTSTPYTSHLTHHEELPFNISSQIWIWWAYSNCGAAAQNAWNLFEHSKETS